MYGVQVFTGEPDVPYEALASVYCTGNEYSTVEKVQMGMIEEALKLGANAIIHVTYERKVTWTSFNALKGTAIAVILQSDTIACPSCAEEIKRAAKKCRFCGEAV